jgi:hypothetical protein
VLCPPLYASSRLIPPVKPSTAELTTAAGLSTILFAALAILAAVVLWHVRPGGQNLEVVEVTDETESAPVAIEESH